MLNDPMESTNVLSEYPEIAAELIQLADTHSLRFYSE